MGCSGKPESLGSILNQSELVSSSVEEELNKKNTEVVEYVNVGNLHLIYLGRLFDKNFKIVYD